MQSFQRVYELCQRQAASIDFPIAPESLHNAISSFLDYRGKKIRPVLCLMSNELFTDIQMDAYSVANAVELFHNFTLVHDDIMDHASLWRGRPSLHIQYG